MTDKRIETAEHVLPGHPDKLCDAAVDAIVGFVTRHDPEAQCGLEAACVFDRFMLTGRIAYHAELLAQRDIDIGGLIRGAYQQAGYGRDEAGQPWGPDPADLRITTALCNGPFAEGEAELRHCADDQAICVGYALANPDTDFLPPAVWLARRIAQELHGLRGGPNAGQIGPDGKVLVRVEREGLHWRPLQVSISLNHHRDSDWMLLRSVAEQAVEAACRQVPTPPISLNGAGMFISGGPNGDNGLSGKKLVVDAYGPGVPIGGGAWSGKDFRKVDRLGGMLARELALDAVNKGQGEEALLTLEYQPGGERPAGINLLRDGKPADGELTQRLLAGGFDNRAVSDRYIDGVFFAPCHPPFFGLALWGHQQTNMPWELAGGNPVATRSLSSRPVAALAASSSADKLLESRFKKLAL